MPNGFIGKISETYLSKAGQALKLANRANAHGRNNLKAPCQEDESMYGGYKTGVGDSSNIVVDDMAFDEIVQRLRNFDRNLSDDFNQILAQIIEMSNTIYVVPTTTPKFLLILSQVKSSLSEFNSLTDNTITHTQNYVSNISNIG